MTILSSIFKFFVGVGLLTQSLFGGHINQDVQNFGTAIPTTYAVFETYLAAQQGTADSVMTLANGTDNSGNALTGYVCFTIDQGQTTQEFECGTASGTAITALQRGINTFGGTFTVATNVFSHRRGADVKITDWPVLGILSNKATGIDSYDNILYYNATNTFTSNNQIVTKKYVDGVAISGAPDS